MDRFSILAALWTLIAVIALSALVPLGLPLSRTTGSAFNPATSDVVLKARAPAAAQAVQAARPHGDDLPPITHPLIAPALPALVAPVGATVFHGVLAAAAFPLRLARAHPARAPPAFF